MSLEEAIRLLNPKTTAEAIAEIESYNGFSGKTVFLTREDAEKALAERRCGGMTPQEAIRRIKEHNEIHS